MSSDKGVVRDTGELWDWWEGSGVGQTQCQDLLLLPWIISHSVLSLGLLWKYVSVEETDFIPQAEILSENFLGLNKPRIYFLELIRML